MLPVEERTRRSEQGGENKEEWTNKEERTRRREQGGENKEE
jgi:hypothetical protein